MGADAIRIRVIAPDIWRERRMTVAPDTAVAEIKRTALPELLGRQTVDPADYYVEYFEKEVLDESQTLAELRVPENGVLSIRPYDLDHPAPFEG